MAWKVDAGMHTFSSLPKSDVMARYAERNKPTRLPMVAPAV